MNLKIILSKIKIIIFQNKLQIFKTKIFEIKIFKINLKITHHLQMINSKKYLNSNQSL